MLERDVFHQYGLVVEQQSQSKDGFSFRTADMNEFLLKRPVIEQEGEFPWYVMVAQYFNQQNEPTMVPIPSRRGKYIETLDNEAFILYQKPMRRFRNEQSDGQRLALLHRKGGNLLAAYDNLPATQPWQVRWQQRMDQMESFREELKNQGQTLREFDEWFIETFPYYSGLAENAVQYIVDAGIDSGTNPFEIRTLAFNRFSSSYHRSSDSLFPNDFILDHPARDLAEWIRFELFECDGDFDTVRMFLWDYHERRTLSKMDWNLMYARLLFPLPYVEAVEHYYSDGNLKEKERSLNAVQRIAKREGEREEIYRTLIHELMGEQSATMRKIDWLV
ncbi:hypothetical protein ABFG93_15785 [Pseudalkalibacillus hwajinpoensis]|uniref:hypothetical protein n=1 Tax=Guptibacillus hwajinpoensis TaxID=208199 RepID=UPI00325C0DB9